MKGIYNEKWRQILRLFQEQVANVKIVSIWLSFGQKTDLQYLKLEQVHTMRIYS